MVREIVYMFLGPWSREAIPWLVDHPLLLSVVFAVWMGVLWAGKIQLRRNENFLKQTTLALAQEWQAGKRTIEPSRIYEQVHKIWLIQLNHLSWFIPHRCELWPIPATPKNVEERIGFSPEWVRKILVQNHILENNSAEQISYKKR